MHSLISYAEPWTVAHVGGWVACLIWNGGVAAILSGGGWHPMILLFHLPAGVILAWSMLRWGRTRVRLDVSPTHLQCTAWPLPLFWSWRVPREDIKDVLVTQRITLNDGSPCAEWTVSVRFYRRRPHVLFRRTSGADEPLHSGVHRLITELAQELLLPITREVRDERKR